jgi:hypothetical protein
MEHVDGYHLAYIGPSQSAVVAHRDEAQGTYNDFRIDSGWLTSCQSSKVHDFLPSTSRLN